MNSEKKYCESSSNPYYLNLNSTAKDYSFNESTSPNYGLLDILTKHIIIENITEIQQPIIKQELVIFESINSK